MSWHYTTLFSYQPLFPSPQTLFAGTMSFLEHLDPTKAFKGELWQICCRHWQQQRCEHVSVRGLPGMTDVINHFSLPQNRRKEDFRWMFCPFISREERHQHERTTSIKDQCKYNKKYGRNMYVYLVMLWQWGYLGIKGRQQEWLRLQNQAAGACGQDLSLPRQLLNTFKLQMFIIILQELGASRSKDLQKSLGRSLTTQVFPIPDLFN